MSFRLSSNDNAVAKPLWLIGLLLLSVSFFTNLSGNITWQKPTGNAVLRSQTTEHLHNHWLSLQIENETSEEDENEEDESILTSGFSEVVCLFKQNSAAPKPFLSFFERSLPFCIYKIYLRFHSLKIPS